MREREKEKDRQTGLAICITKVSLFTDTEQEYRWQLGTKIIKSGTIYI